MKRQLLQIGVLLLCTCFLASGCKKSPKKTKKNDDSSNASVTVSKEAGVDALNESDFEEPIEWEHELDERKSAFGQTNSTGGAPTNPEYEKQRMEETLTMQLTDERIYWHGRTKVTEESAYMDWSGSGFQLQVKGGKVLAEIFGVDNGPANVSWIAVYVNGVRTQKIKIASGKRWYTLAENLPSNRMSDVRVVKLSEASQGILTVFAIQTTGKVGRVTPRSRRILWIGDSITSGYGVLSKPSDPFTTETEDITATFGWLLSEQYKAEAQFFSASGYGVATSISGSKTDGIIPPIFSKLSFMRKNGGTVTPNSFVPDLIVINLGSNDVSGGSNADDLCLGAYNFLYDLHTMYPGATLVWTYGNTIDNYIAPLEAQVKQFGEKYGKTYFVKGYRCEDTERGSGGHPNSTGHQKIAALLAENIHTIFGW